MTEIKIQINEVELLASVYDTPTGRSILAALPIESSVATWGDEIYFQIPAKASLESGASAEVLVGDLAYWPTLPAFCIFFGPTPVSKDQEPRAASAVNVFGQLKSVDPDLLRNIGDGARVSVQKV